MRLRSIAIGLCAVFLICDQGYCLFRDDVGAPQVYSAIKMQRAKDEQRKNEIEQVKPQSASKEMGQNETIYNSQTNMSAVPLTSSVATTSSALVAPIPQYKRLTPQGIIVDTPQPLLAQSAAVENKTESSKSHQGLIFLFLFLGIIGLVVFKQTSSK